MLDKNNLPSSRDVIKEIIFRHPILNENYAKAKKRIDDIQGVRNIYYAGAWLGYGFHEDGVKSAVQIAKKYNIRL